MKKIIRLTESHLIRMIKKVIKEQGETSEPSTVDDFCRTGFLELGFRMGGGNSEDAGLIEFVKTEDGKTKKFPINVAFYEKYNKLKIHGGNVKPEFKNETEFLYNFAKQNNVKTVKEKLNPEQDLASIFSLYFEYNGCGENDARISAVQFMKEFIPAFLAKFPGYKKT